MQKQEVSNAQLRRDFGTAIHTSSYHTPSQWKKVTNGYILQYSPSQSSGPTTKVYTLQPKGREGYRFHPEKSPYYGNGKIVTDEQLKTAFSVGEVGMPKWVGRYHKRSYVAL
jgi:hypothetical protein